MSDPNQTIHCLPFRQALLTDPHQPDGDILAHLPGCDGCRSYQASLITADARLKQAMTITVPENLVPRIMLAVTDKRRPKWSHWISFSAAASITLAVVILATQFGGEQATAAELIGHVEHEIDVVSSHVKAEDAKNADAALTRIEMQGSLPQGEILFAGNCVHHGRLIAHILMQTSEGQVTLLYLPDEHFSLPISTKGDWTMVSQHHGKGSVVLLSREISDLKFLTAQL